MRTSTILFASILATAAFTGCQKSNPAGDDDASPDAAGSGSGSGSGNDPNAAFTIQSTDLTIQPGAEVTYCYWFHTPNTTSLTINKWVSDMTPGSHHMIYFSGGSEPATGDGIDMNNTCGGFSGNGGAPQWVFASQSAHLEEDLPSDDGTGKPLAQVVAPNTVGAFQMHYINTTDAALTVHVKLAAYALPDSTPFTRTDAFVTYNQDISIPPGAVGATATGTCPTPANVKFWTVSTHSHKQSVDVKISDTSGMIFDSTDWEHPGAKTWDATPFYTMAGNSLTWTCTYNNNDPNDPNSSKTITAGQSALTNEMCMATGYYFPSTAPKFSVEIGGTCHQL
jgi:hypothetical protein